MLSSRRMPEVTRGRQKEFSNTVSQQPFPSFPRMCSRSALPAPVYQTPQLYPDERAAAHETRLTAGIQRIFFEVRDPRPRAEIPNQSRFGVISGIVLRVNPIFALENDLSAFDEHRAEPVRFRGAPPNGKALSPVS